MTNRPAGPERDKMTTYDGYFHGRFGDAMRRCVKVANANDHTDAEAMECKRGSLGCDGCLWYVSDREETDDERVL